MFIKCERFIQNLQFWMTRRIVACLFLQQNSKSNFKTGRLKRWSSIGLVFSLHSKLLGKGNFKDKIFLSIWKLRQSTNWKMTQYETAQKADIRVLILGRVVLLVDCSAVIIIFSLQGLSIEGISFISIFNHAKNYFRGLIWRNDILQCMIFDGKMFLSKLSAIKKYQKTY